MAAGPAPSRNAGAAVFCRSAWKWRAPPSTKTNDGEKAIEGGEESARDAGRRVADHGDGLDHRPGRDLPERDGVEELAVRHPVVVVDGVLLHQRHDHEAAAVRERTDLDRDPRQREDTAPVAGADASSIGRRVRRGDPRAELTDPSSRAPQANNTTTSHGPTVAAEMPPASA